MIYQDLQVQHSDRTSCTKKTSKDSIPLIENCDRKPCLIGIIHQARKNHSIPLIGIIHRSDRKSSPLVLVGPFLCHLLDKLPPRFASAGTLFWSCLLLATSVLGFLFFAVLPAFSGHQDELTSGAVGRTSWDGLWKKTSTWRAHSPFYVLNFWFQAAL